MLKNLKELGQKGKHAGVGVGKGEAERTHMLCWQLSEAYRELQMHASSCAVYCQSLSNCLYCKSPRALLTPISPPKPHLLHDHAAL